MRVAVLLLVLAGCGRCGYAPATAEERDAAATDAGTDPATDAGADTGTALGLIAWYPMDDDPSDGVDDASGNGHHADCNGGPCPTRLSRDGDPAVEFDELELLRVPYHADFATTTGFTVCAFAMPDRSDRMSIVAKPLGTFNGNSWQIELLNEFEVTFTSGSAAEGHDMEISAAILDTGTWYHLCITWDGTNKRIYLDGAEIHSGTGLSDFDENDVFIGGDFNSGSPALRFNGGIDEVRIYGNPLSGARIAELAAM